MAGPDWRQMLDAARRCARKDAKRGGGGGFTSTDLAYEAGIQKTTKSSAVQVSSAWCAKLRRWGYISSVVNAAGGGARWSRLWQLTEKGEGGKKRKRRAAGP